MDLRTALAAVLGVGLGLVLLAFPGTVLRIQLAGRYPQDRHGEYGVDGTPTRWTRVIQAIGALVLLGGLYFAWTLS